MKDTTDNAASQQGELTSYVLLCAPEQLARVRQLFTAALLLSPESVTSGAQVALAQEIVVSGVLVMEQDPDRQRKLMEMILQGINIRFAAAQEAQAEMTRQKDLFMRPPVSPQVN